MSEIPVRGARGVSVEAAGSHPPALDHGAIGNGRLLALVSPTSAVDWLCLPTFGSGSVFASLLDPEHGGHFRFESRSGVLRGHLAYLRNTNVLRTEFEEGDDAWEVIDFAPRIPEGLGVRAPLELVRLVRPLRGRPQIAVRFDPRPDYGRSRVSLVPGTTSLSVQWDGPPLELATDLPLAYVVNGQSFALDRPFFFVLSWGARTEPVTLAEVHSNLELTVAGWQAWCRTCALPTFAPEAVLRSALCLKLHACEDTGAIIAAATTSIPEAMGTERTWDYRYCWLRDAAFVVEALRRLSHLQEGEMFLRFLRDVAETGPLQPLYGIDGCRELPEEMLPHLAGFGGNGHVRIGNAAAAQRQNDLMGEMILCMETLLLDPRLVVSAPESYFPLIRRLVEDAIVAAGTDDTGIWEFRSVLRPHTFSRAMCWVAIHRGAVLARRLGEPDHARRWEGVAAQEQNTILARGFNRDQGCFTQSLDGETADASLLLLPALGLIDAHDPRFVSTVDAYDRLLNVGDGLLLRYRDADDFGWPTSAFAICGFWMAEAQALVGRLDEAAARFERLMTHANPLGLFSEDIDPATGALLGNFPQAYTHVGLIHAALTIGELLEARDGKVRAWV